MGILFKRQREGIAVARAKGVYIGRIRGSKESSKDFLSKYPEVTKHLRKGQSSRNTAVVNQPIIYILVTMKNDETISVP